MMVWKSFKKNKKIKKHVNFQEEHDIFVTGQTSIILNLERHLPLMVQFPSSYVCLPDCISTCCLKRKLQDSLAVSKQLVVSMLFDMFRSTSIYLLLKINFGKGMLINFIATKSHVIISRNTSQEKI